MCLTMACSKIVMGFWSRKVNKILLEGNLRIWLTAGYVDDMRYVTSILEKGRRWVEKEKRFVYKDDWEQEDMLEKESDNARTSREIGKVMNSIYRHIKFTTEIPEDFTGGKLPTLDLAMWMDSHGEGENEMQTREKIEYKFYEKEMGSKFCVMENSAMNYNSKRSILSQEVIRRMQNTSEEVGQDERNEILEGFIEKMKRSGYNQVQIKEIICSGLKGYQTKLEKANKEGRKMQRDGKDTVEARYRKKIMAKSTWFKNKRKKNVESGAGKQPGPKGGKVAQASHLGQNSRDRKKCDSGPKNEGKIEPVTVMFIPRTTNGELSTLLRNAEKEISAVTGDTVKFVEKAGKMLQSDLNKANPWGGENCQRGDCLLCRDGQEGNGDCRRRNVVYRTSCQACQVKGKDTVYYGETSRTGFERGLEHARDFVTMKDDSHMHTHTLEEHPGEEQVKFSMKILKGHLSALTRQIHEAVVIKRNCDKNILNSKFEYNRCIIPELTVKMGSRDMDTEKKDTDCGMSEGEEEIQVGKRRCGKRKEGEKGEKCDSQNKSKKYKRWHPVESTSGKRKPSLGIEVMQRRMKKPRTEIHKYVSDYKECLLPKTRARTSTKFNTDAAQFKDIKTMFETMSKRSLKKSEEKLKVSETRIALSEHQTNIKNEKNRASSMSESHLSTSSDFDRKLKMFREKSTLKPEGILEAKISQGKNDKKENFQQKITQSQIVLKNVSQIGRGKRENLAKPTTTATAGPAQPNHQPQNDSKVNTSPSPACRHPPATKKGIKRFNPSRSNCRPISSFVERGY